MAKTIQDQLAEKIKEKFPEAEVKKVNQDNYVDIHLPGVHLKRGTHLFFNTAGGAIKLGFYCREEDFTQQVLAKNGNLEAYSQGVRLKGNPEWRKVDAACDAAFAFVESLTGFPSQGSSRTPRASASGNVGSTLLQGIKAAYPKCIVNEEKSYASFTFKAAFLYELRIQKGTIRLLAANYPQKASVAKCFELIARHDLFIHKIQNRYPVIVEPGKVSPDKLTVRIEIPYQGSDLENEGFITNLIATCEQFHEAVAPLINGFQTQPVGTLSEVMGDGTTPTKTSEAAPKKESPAATPVKGEAQSMFDLTEFDEEGRPIGKKEASQAPSQKEAEDPALDLNTFLSNLGMEGETTPTETPTPAQAKKNPDAAQFDESDRCLEDPRPFLTCIQLIRIYFLALSSGSKDYRTSYEETLREFTKAAVVPRISNDMLRLAHEDGNLIESLLLGPMLQAEEIYDKNYVTHNDYTQSLAGQIEELLPFCNTGLFLDTLELFMYLGDMLEEEDSPSGSLAPQDRYFILFLMLKASPEQSPENLEMVLDKGAKSRNAKSGCDVKSLLLKASGNFDQLSNEEKLALVLYDFILWDEKPGLDIKIADITAAQNIFKVQTAKSPVSEKLIGGFKDNASYEIFQFFNVEFNREGFHAFCLERWKEFLLEWELGFLKVLVVRLAEDFHPNTYRNNPVLEEYLEIYQGFRKTIAESTTRESLSVDEEEDDFTETLVEFIEAEVSDENEEDADTEDVPNESSGNLTHLYFPNSNLLIERDYEEVSEISGGLIKVKYKGLFGFLNNEGKEVIECKYFYAAIAESNIAVVGDKDDNSVLTVHYFDFQGKLKLSLSGFEVFKLPNNEGIWVKKDETWQFLDWNGKVVFEGEYDDEGITNFYNGYAWVKIEEVRCTINKKGEINKIGEFEELNFLKNNLYAAKQNDKYAFFNYKGEQLSGFDYDDYEDFDEGYAIVHNNGKCGVINTNYKLVIPCNFDLIESFSQGVFAAQLDEKYGFITPENKIVSEFKYDEVWCFIEGYCIVMLNDKHGIIDMNFKEVIPCISEEYPSVNHGKKYATICIDEKYRLYSLTTGKPVTSKTYQNMLFAGDGKEWLLTRANNKWGYISYDEKIIIDYLFDDAWPFSEELAKVQIKDKFGFIDIKGKLVIDSIYMMRDWDEGCCQGVIIVSKDGTTFGLINKAGTEISQFIYTEIEEYGSHFKLTINNDTEEEDEEDMEEIEEYPYSIDEVNKTVEMSVFHQVLFLILYVGGKTENHTDEEIADVSSTAVTMGVWFDKDEDEGLEVLEETFEVLQKCGELFTTEEILKIADECCFSIHDDVTNADAQKDIIRFITDQANADGELDLWEETIIDSWSLNITIGRGWGN